MKHSAILSVVALLLLAGCTKNNPSVVDMPYYDGNTILPATELMQVVHTDSTTELTFMTMYEYYDLSMALGEEIYLLTAGSDTLPIQSLEPIGNTEINYGQIRLRKGVPSEYKMIFPAIDKNADYVDFIQQRNGKDAGSIWGIDLTGKRSNGEYPAEIPAELFAHDFTNDTLPRLVTDSGTATVRVHVCAWRPWQSPEGTFYVNTMADKQIHIPFTLDKNGEATVKIPLEGTANINAQISSNTY